MIAAPPGSQSRIKNALLAAKSGMFKDKGIKKYIAENPKLSNPYSLYNTENRLNQILNLLPDGALVNEFSGEMGRKKIYRYVIEPKENEGKRRCGKG